MSIAKSDHTCCFHTKIRLHLRSKIHHTMCIPKVVFIFLIVCWLKNTKWTPFLSISKNPNSKSHQSFDCALSIRTPPPTNQPLKPYLHLTLLRQFSYRSTNLQVARAPGSVIPSSQVLYHTSRYLCNYIIFSVADALPVGLILVQRQSIYH